MRQVFVIFKHITVETAYDFASQAEDPAAFDGADVADYGDIIWICLGGEDAVATGCAYTLDIVAGEVLPRPQDVLEFLPFDASWRLHRDSVFRDLLVMEP